MTDKRFHDYVFENLSRIGEIKTRKMMGEYLVYYQGVLIGGIYDDVFLVKRTNSSKKLLNKASEVYPYIGSKTLMLAVEELEDEELMRELLIGLYDDLK